MSNTENNDKALTSAQIQAAVAKAHKANDTAGVVAMWSQADGLEVSADSKALTTRAAAWQAKGSVLVAICQMAGVKDSDLHTIGQADIVKHAEAAGLKGLTADRAKRFVRANLYLKPTLLTEAEDLAGTAKGPHTLDIMHVLRWCQAHHEIGFKSLKGCSEGTKAAAILANSHKALAKADVDSKATAAAEALAKLTEGQAILKAATAEATANDVYGPLTAGRWSALTNDELDKAIATAQGVKAARAKAKAEAPKAPKGTKAPKAEAILPGSPEFSALVAAAVAEALAKS